MLFAVQYPQDLQRVACGYLHDKVGRTVHNPSVLENVYRLRGIEIDGYGVGLQHLLVEEHLPEKSAN